MIETRSPSGTHADVDEPNHAVSRTATTYVIVDKVTGKLDWDGELHPSIEAAIESMCGQSQSYVRSEDEATDEDRTVWSEDYEIRRVLPLANRPVQYRTVKP